MIKNNIMVIRSIRPLNIPLLTLIKITRYIKHMPFVWKGGGIRKSNPCLKNRRFKVFTIQVFIVSICEQNLNSLEEVNYEKEVTIVRVSR